MLPLSLHGRGKFHYGRAGAQYFDRLTGLNILFDEVTVAHEMRSQAPRYVSIALTNTCELRCPFCYAPKTPGNLDVDQVRAWAEELDAAGCLGIGFGGGEPTAHPHLVRLCKEVAQETRLAVSLTTHGHRINEELARKLRGNVHFIRVSVDGVGATYEQIRGKSFDSLLQRVETVSSICPFGFNVVINDSTVEQLDDIHALAIHVGAAELLFLPEHPVGGRPGASSDAIRRLKAWILDGRGAGMRLAISNLGLPEGLPIANPFPEEDALDGHAHVDANSTLRLSAYATHGVPIRHSIMEAVDILRRRDAP